MPANPLRKLLVEALQRTKDKRLRLWLRKLLDAGGPDGSSIFPPVALAAEGKAEKLRGDEMQGDEPQSSPKRRLVSSKKPVA